MAEHEVSRTLATGFAAMVEAMVIAFDISAGEAIRWLVKGPWIPLPREDVLEIWVESWFAIDRAERDDDKIRKVQAYVRRLLDGRVVITHVRGWTTDRDAEGPWFHYDLNEYGYQHIDWGWHLDEQGEKVFYSRKSIIHKVS